jgi:leucyl-tRNA synthetase
MTSTINGDEDFLMSDTTTEHGAAAGDPGGDQQAERVPYRYTARMAGEIEAFWQDRWEKEGTFEAPNPAGPMAEPEKIGHRPKLYVMDMFPYPSGAGLHVGHPLGYVATDCYARYKWMTGHNVLHTMGFDAFGLPAEQYAVQTGRHPRITTEQNIEGYRAQLRRLGLGHDRRRSIATIDPAYYRWTQWIFLQIFNSWYDEDQDKARPIAELIAEYESGRRPTPDGRAWSDLSEVERRSIIDSQRLAYMSEQPVNWSPGLGTVLSNEEVTAEGRSERGNFPVFKRNLTQWMMRMTAYAERLLDDLDLLDWPEPIKLQQRNWIGRSEGARIDFPVSTVDGEQQTITVFTTRPDTVFGATYMVLAPEHPLVDRLTPERWPAATDGGPLPAAWTGGQPTPAEAVAEYRRQTETKSDVERQVELKEKTGVFVGSYATNPVNDQKIPVFVADYVLMGYGTGAIMAVPGQDQRDWDFAEQYGLPIIRTVQPPEEFDGEAYLGDGPATNSSSEKVSLDGLDVAEAIRAIIAWLEANNVGQGMVTYKLRDWLFSRQRYWGEPFPIVHDEHGPIAVPESMLPVELPDVDDYSPKLYDPNDKDSQPEAPLARATDWVEVTLDLGDGPKHYQRETDVMPNWAGSCWYELRYLDPTNAERFCDPEVERYWMGPEWPGDSGGVDLYVGGAEHAVLHLLYARFWHKILYDLGYVSSKEPFRKLFNQGMIQAYAFTDQRGAYVPAAEVEETDSGWEWRGEQVNRQYGRMGKSLKNVVTPDEVCAQYGADTFRLYEMSMGPLDQGRPWETRAVVGSFRFLQRVWRNIVDEVTGATTVVDTPADEETRKAVHRAIDGVRNDMEALRFNTAIAKLIELNNHLTKRDAPVPREVAEPLVQLLSPFAPHIGEELWSRLGHAESVTFSSLPEADPALLAEETVVCVVQVAGKLRDRLEVPVSISEDELRERALASPGVRRALGDRTVRTVVIRAPRLVNVVPA